MSTSDTDTTAASAALARLRNTGPDPEDSPGTVDKPDADGSELAAIAQAAKPRTTVEPPQKPSAKAPTTDSAQAVEAATEVRMAAESPQETLSQRIAHPVPHHLPTDPHTLDEVLHPTSAPADAARADSGPQFRHMTQGNVADDQPTIHQPASAAHKPKQPLPRPLPPTPAPAAAATQKTPTPGTATGSTVKTLKPAASPAPAPTAEPAAAKKAAATAGGFTLINHWLDSIQEPNWEAVGDKVYASPKTFVRWLRKVRVERAHAAEERERTRLLEAARIEALAEAAKRQAAVDAENLRLERLEQERVEELRLQQERIDQALREQERLDQERLELERLELEHREQARLEQLALSEQATKSHPIAQQGVQDAALASAADTVSLPAAQRQTPIRMPLPPEQLAALVASAKASIERHRALADPVYIAPYTLPDTSPNPAVTRLDLIQRLVFTVIAALLALGMATGIGDLLSGSLPGQHPHHSLLSLAPTAYLLLPVIYGWSLLGSIFSWLPSQRSALRQRAVGWLFPAALLGGGLWLLAVRAEMLLPAFLAAALTTALLLLTVRELNRRTARSTLERMFSDAPIGLMTGFFLVVTAASGAELLTSWNASMVPVAVASVIVLALGYVATSLSMTERGRIIMASGFAWGMFWLLVPRLLGPNPSIVIAILAGMAGFVVLLATENRRYQIHHAEHRAARGKSTEF